MYYYWYEMKRKMCILQRKSIYGIYLVKSRYCYPNIFSGTAYTLVNFIDYLLFFLQFWIQYYSVWVRFKKRPAGEFSHFSSSRFCSYYCEWVLPQCFCETGKQKWKYERSLSAVTKTFKTNCL